VTRRALGALLLLCSVAVLTACDGGTENLGRSDACPGLEEIPAARVLVLGDSNLFESSEQVDAALSGFERTLDGVPALGLKDLDDYWLDRLPALLADDPDVVVVALGTNDTTTPTDVDGFAARLDTMMAALGDRDVVWLTHVDPRPAEVAGGAAAVNAAIRAAPARWPNLTVLDRTPVLTEHPELLRDDDLHFTAEGMQSFADAIRDAASDAVRVRTVAGGDGGFEGD
jgi:lysophospholipase L1-like esterase